jgi:hypothetical protein
MKAGWWLSHPSEKYESVGIIIPNRKNIEFMFQTTNQMVSPLKNKHEISRDFGTSIRWRCWLVGAPYPWCWNIYQHLP